MNRIVAAIAALCVLPLAGAQQLRPITLKLSNVPVREALAKVGDAAGVSFAVKREVSGTVNVDTVRGEFSTVLRDVLSQIDAISEFQNGNYVIRPIRHAKAASGLPAKSPAETKSVLAEYENADVRLVLKELCAQYGYKLNLSGDVVGTVTLYMKNCSLDLVLQNVLKQVDAQYIWTKSQLVITRREQVWPSSDDSTVPPPAP